MTNFAEFHTYSKNGNITQVYYSVYRYMGRGQGDSKSKF